MTVHGIIDIALREEQQQTLKYQEAYVSLTKFMTSSFGALNGIQRIAYSTGSAPLSKGGEGYWDEGLSAYPNAWSCYKFLSASVPFYLLVQFTWNNSFGTLPGNPGAIDGTSTANGVGIAIAMRADGGNPWNGTSSNNGTDTKGTPVWTAGASSLLCWPRSNSTGGTNTTNKEMTMGVILSKAGTGAGAGPPFGTHFSFVCDFDNMAFVSEDAADGQYRATYFGKYTVRTNITASCPYVSLRSSAATNNPAFPLTTYGPTTSGFAVADGGIAHPTTVASGTRTLQISALSEFFGDSSFEMSTRIGRWDEFPIHVAVAESPMFGYAGYIDWVKLVPVGLNLSLNPDKSRAIFGAQLASANSPTTKLSIPWNGTIVPGTSVSRTGTMF